MSTETVRTTRSRRAALAALVALLSLSAINSAHATPRSMNFRAHSQARSYHSPSFRAPQARSYYSPSSSMIAPPMQQAAPIAPLSPHVTSGF
jgi:hypothetical protein